MDFFRKFLPNSKQRKQKSKLSDGHPYDINSLPTGARMHYDEGQILLGKGDLPGAELELVEANRIAPWHKMVLFILVQVYIQQDKTNDARSLIEALLDESPQDYFAILLKALLAEHEGNLEQAIEFYGNGLYRKFYRSQPYIRYARLLADVKQDFKRAKRQLEIARQVEPTNIEIYLLEIHIAQLENDLEAESRVIDDAIEIGTAIITHYPDDYLGYNMRGWAYYHLEEYDKAISDFTKSISLNPSDTYSYRNRANIYFDTRDYDKALEDANMLVKIDEESGLRYRTAILYRLGKVEDAISEINRLNELNSSDARIYNSRAWYKAFVGDYSSAMDDANKSLELNEEYSNAYATKGLLNWHFGIYESALENFTTAQKLDDENAIHRMLIGVALIKLGRQSEAIATWESATNNDSEYKTAQDFQEKVIFPPPFYEAMQELEKLANDS